MTAVEKLITRLERAAVDAERRGRADVAAAAREAAAGYRAAWEKKRKQ